MESAKSSQKKPLADLLENIDETPGFKDVKTEDLKDFKKTIDEAIEKDELSLVPPITPHFTVKTICSLDFTLGGLTSQQFAEQFECQVTIFLAGPVFGQSSLSSLFFFWICKSILRILSCQKGI